MELELTVAVSKEAGPNAKVRSWVIELEQLLLDVVADGFTVYCCGPRTAPTALAASYEWEQCIDLITIRSWDRVTAARVPKLGRADVFAPDVVVWAYEGSAECAIRALLDLVHPEHPDAPTGIYPAPRSLCVPQDEQRPMTIRLPSANRAGVRAARLACVADGLATSQ